MSSKFQNLNSRVSNFLLLATFAAVGFTLFSLFPSIIFYSYEGWSYLDSIYFTIITLTTIGFGDFVAGKKIAVYFHVHDRDRFDVITGR